MSPFYNNSAYGRKKIAQKIDGLTMFVIKLRLIVLFLDGILNRIF